MSTRIENVPKLRTTPSSIDAKLYNLVRLTLIRADTPLRLRLPGLRTIDVVLNKNTWVCLDRAMYDLPALAWTNINEERRQGLHEAVDCQLHYYHIHANISASKVLDSLVMVLEEIVAKSIPASSGELIRLPQTDQTNQNSK